jgi:hypothetical protein
MKVSPLAERSCRTSGRGPAHVRFCVRNAGSLVAGASGIERGAEGDRDSRRATIDGVRLGDRDREWRTEAAGAGEGIPKPDCVGLTGVVEWLHP